MRRKKNRPRMKIKGKSNLLENSQRFNNRKKRSKQR